MKTTYEIINNGRTISPTLDRDEYYKIKWCSENTINARIKELDFALEIFKKAKLEANYQRTLIQIQELQRLIGDDE